MRVFGACRVLCAKVVGATSSEGFLVKYFIRSGSVPDIKVVYHARTLKAFRHQRDQK